MKIINVFDAIKDGTYEDFIKMYDGNANQVNKALGLSLLQCAVVNDKQPEDKLKMIDFLINENVDVNYFDTKYQRNALHFFFFTVWRPSSSYLFNITSKLVYAGIDINAQDKFNAIPMKYLITVNKLPFDDIKDTCEFLLEKGADITNKDFQGKTCVDYAREYSWRNEFLYLIENA